MDVRDVRKDLSAERRAALRSRVLVDVDPSHEPSLRERLVDRLASAGDPLPILSRIGTIGIVVIALVGFASVASADSLPEDPLYSLKLNSEQMRLSLANSAADRASVELTIAETRLREASALAAQDRDAEADVAASSFGEYLATAVASLEESSTGPSALVEQLRSRVVQQGDQLRLTADTAPNAVSVLATAAQEISAPGADAEAIADAAARAAEQAAAMAKLRADAVAAAPQTRVAQQPQANPSVRATLRTFSAEQRARLQAAAKAARDAAQRARAAADRAKKAAAERSRRELDRGTDQDRGDQRDRQDHHEGDGDGDR